MTARSSRRYPVEPPSAARLEGQTPSKCSRHRRTRLSHFRKDQAGFNAAMIP